MSRVLFQIGPVTIYWYSFLILIAVIIGYQIVVSYSKKISYKTNEIMDMVLYLVIFSIIGARAYYVIFNFSLYQDDLLSIFMIWKGGLAIYGGIIAAILYILYYCKKKGLDFIRVLDIYSLSLLLGQAIGRWGNFFNGEAYGGKTTLEALQSLHLPRFIIDGMYIDGFYRQPTFLYESIWCLIGVFFLIRIRKRYTNQVGRQVSFYLIWYGIGRFFIEGLRSDSLYLGIFRVSQLVSVVMVVIGFALLFRIKHQGKVKNTIIGGEDGRI
ncbi:MAG: prolipoprotein diacylglyceryl transferase [Bacilli bacterium]|nr:prolipoprotein diacylglyceryl transferase [Bacilli bacterium]